MADPNTNDLKNQRLLSAYLDGELGVADRALAENLIRDNPRYAQLVEQWREGGINLRAMPKYSLDEGFADRVLGNIAQVSDQQVGDQQVGDQQVGDQQVATHSRTRAISENSPKLDDRDSGDSTTDRIALLAIGALCASLLLTLFAFPALVSDSPSVETIAAKSTNEKIEIEPGAESGADSSVDQGHAEKVVRAQGPIVRVPRAMKLAGGNIEGGAVNAIEVAETTQNVERILHIEIQADREPFDFEKVLSKYSIKTAGDKDLGSLDQSDVVAIYALASLDQMYRAAQQLTDDFSAKVTVIPVPIVPINAGNATRLDSRSFKSRSSDSEIAELDQWFGLVEDSDGSRSIRFLILLSR